MSRFETVVNTSPKRLSQQQIEQYNHQGFVSALDAFSSQEIARHRAYFDRLLDQVGAQGAYAINCYQARCAGIWDIATAPQILDWVEDLLGPDIVCWATHMFCKLPGDRRAVPMHQDASYWHLDPTKTVTVWLAIDDADAENATMDFVAGTHVLGPLAWKAVKGEVLDREIEGVDALGSTHQIVTNTLRAGQISMHADMLAHGSPANLSNRRRCGLTLRYFSPEVRATDDAWYRGIEAIVARGHDPSGYWRHHPRPIGDDLSGLDYETWGRPKNIGGN